MIKQKNNKKRLLITLLAAAAILVVAGGGAYYWNQRKDKSVTIDGVTYAPATDEERQESEDHKKELEERIKVESQTPSQDGSKTAVTPVIVDASQYDNVVEVSAYVPGVIEDSGTCTVTVKKGTTTITKTVTGTKDATTTRCPIVSIPRSEFSSTGNWTVAVSYSSSGHSGSSKSQEIVIR